MRFISSLSARIVALVIRLIIDPPSIRIRYKYLGTLYISISPYVKKFIVFATVLIVISIDPGSLVLNINTYSTEFRAETSLVLV